VYKSEQITSNKIRTNCTDPITNRTNQNKSNRFETKMYRERKRQSVCVPRERDY